MTVTYYIPVDRRNAFAWLSRGLILPPSVMEKYKSDALEAVPNALPLALPGAVGRLASAAEMPVVLELAPGVCRSSDVDGEQSQPVALTRGALSARRIARVHVASAHDAEEVLARAYRGVDGGQLDLTVSPELFEAGDQDLPWPPEDAALAQRPDDNVLRRREAIAGAVVSAASPQLVDVFLRNALEAGGAVDEFTLLVTAAGECGLVAGEEDRKLLEGVLRVLFDQTTSGDLVASELLRQLSAVMSDAGVNGLEPHFQRILQLIRGEDELRPFKRSGGLLASKALLLYLLRPDPADVRGWPDEELNAEPEVLHLSQLLAGFASRYGGLPVAQRQVQGIDELLDWVARGLQPNDFATDVSEPSQPVKDESGKPGSSTSPATDRQALTDEITGGKTERGVAVAQALGWLDCLTLQVVAESFEARTQGRRVRVSFASGAVIEWVLEVDSFMERLRSVDDAALTAALQGEQPKRKRATRKRTPSKPKPDAPTDVE